MTRVSWNEPVFREFHQMRPSEMRPSGERGRIVVSREAWQWSGSCWETPIFTRPVTPQPQPGFLSIIASRHGAV